MTDDYVDRRSAERAREQEDEFLRFAMSALYESEHYLEEVLSEALNHNLTEVEVAIKKPHGDTYLTLGVLVFDFEPLRSRRKVADGLIALSTSVLARFAKEGAQTAFQGPGVERSWPESGGHVVIRYQHGLIRDGREIEVQHKYAPFQRYLSLVFEPMEEALPQILPKSSEKALIERR